MSNEIVVHNSEGITPSSSRIVTTTLLYSSTPWSFNPRSKHENTNSDGFLFNSGKILVENSVHQMVPPTPINARVPYRSKPLTQLVQETKRTFNSEDRSSFLRKICDKKVGKTSSQENRSLYRQPLKPLSTRKPLEVHKDKVQEQQNQTPEFSDSDEDMKSVSSSSSQTSIKSDSSISPISPLKRYQRRMPLEDTAGKHGESKISVKSNPDTKYQKLMTKYFKVKKANKRLQNQHKYDQSRIASLEFLRQQDAALMQVSETTELRSQAGQLYVKNENYGNVFTGIGRCAEIDSVQSGNVLSISNKTTDNIALDNCSSSKGSIASDFKVEFMASSIVNDQSLRPIIYKVPLESPPSRMPEIIAKLSKSGSCCESCGKKWKETNKK